MSKSVDTVKKEFRNWKMNLKKLLRIRQRKKKKKKGEAKKWETCDVKSVKKKK